MSFYKNGKCQGVAYRLKWKGEVYFPALSLYNKAVVSVCFEGFQYPPSAIETKQVP